MGPGNSSGALTRSYHLSSRPGLTQNLLTELRLWPDYSACNFYCDERRRAVYYTINTFPLLHRIVCIVYEIPPRSVSSSTRTSVKVHLGARAQSFEDVLMSSRKMVPMLGPAGTATAAPLLSQSFHSDVAYVPKSYGGI
jgi:hypothetical protein